MKINKNEYDNIVIPVILEDVVQEAMDEGLERKPYRRTRWIRYAGAVAAVFFVGIVTLLNTSQAFAKALTQTPVIGAVCEIFTFRDYSYRDASKYVNVRIPQISNTGCSDLEQQINREISRVINKEVEISEQNAQEEYQAYLMTGGKPEEFVPYNIVVDYEIKCKDTHYVSFVITKDETRASGYYQAFYYNIDLDTGKQITLRDWYGSSYKQIIRDSINKQIDAWDADQKMYLWDDLDLTDLINEDTQFYINDNEQVVISFNKYELGAGAMGTQEFVIR